MKKSIVIFVIWLTSCCPTIADESSPTLKADIKAVTPITGVIVDYFEGIPVIEKQGKGNTVLENFNYSTDGFCSTGNKKYLAFNPSKQQTAANVLCLTGKAPGTTVREFRAVSRSPLEKSKIACETETFETAAGPVKMLVGFKVHWRNWTDAYVPDDLQDPLKALILQKSSVIAGDQILILNNMHTEKYITVVVKGAFAGIVNLKPQGDYVLNQSKSSISSVKYNLPYPSGINLSCE